jgi:hypothetical protein
MSCSCSWPLPLFPSCLPIMPPDIFQVATNLGLHWGPSGGLPWGNGPEHMLGHLECLQRHDLLNTLELPMLSGVTLQYLIESEEAVDSLSCWVCESGC